MMLTVINPFNYSFIGVLDEDYNTFFLIMILNVKDDFSN